MSARPPQLEHLEFLGDATMFAARIQALIPKCTLLENFSHAEVSSLANFMDVYRAEAGMEIIGEGQGGDFMLMLSQRLRATSERLLGLLDEKAEAGSVPHHLL